MTLDPLMRDAWSGLTDLLRPLPGYRLDAALLTTFGMSFEALLASLLALHDVEEAGDQPDTISRVIAATRTANKVRVLVQAGTVSAPLKTLPPALASLLEPIVVPVTPDTGVFHPKLWLLRFAAASERPPFGMPEWMVRVVVGSRNLTASDNLELGLSLTGTPARRPDGLAQQLGQIMGRCEHMATRPVGDIVQTLTHTLRSCAFDGTPEMAKAIDLHWQEPGQARIADALPTGCREIIAISPFVGDSTVRDLLSRSDRLTLISNPTELAHLSAETLAVAEARSTKQGRPALLAFQDGIADGGSDEPTEGEGESPYIDSVHAKALFIETATGETLSLIGSANATMRGWGLTSSRNVECMAAMTPGVPPGIFRSQFMEDKQGALKGWLQPFRAEQRQDVSEDDRLERELQLTAQLLAGLAYAMRYEQATSTLSVTLAPDGVAPAVSTETTTELLPFALFDETSGERSRDSWQSLAGLNDSSLVFLDIPLARVSPFLVIRVSRAGVRSHYRIACATLDLGDTARQARDDAARAELLASTDPADVLDKLVAGLGFSGRGSSRQVPDGVRRSDLVRGSGKRPHTSLEQLLRAIVAYPHLARELTLLLGDHLDDEVRRFVSDLQHATVGVA
jgi:hypothetical protein